MQMQGDGKNDPGLDNPNPGSHCPAIWLYPRERCDVVLALDFRGDGFMTTSSPAYNDRWRIHVDPSQPFNRYSSTFVDDPWVPHLDYDGFRDGKFQTTEGWCIEQAELLDWQRSTLRELGFTPAEVDEANIDYGRMLLSRKYKQPLFAVYPQTTELVEQSVALDVQPTPDTVYRLWLYFVPVASRPEGLKAPRVPRIERKGFTVVELAYLSDREIPNGIKHPRQGEAKGRHFVGRQTGRDPHRVGG
jgi:hypothetical protein